MTDFVGGAGQAFLSLATRLLGSTRLSLTFERCLTENIGLCANSATSTTTSALGGIREIEGVPPGGRRSAA